MKIKKTQRKAPDSPRCSAKRKRGGHIKATSSLECPSRWHFCFSLISMHHNGFTKSFACCLSCESCLCAQCQMPGQGRGGVGEGGEGGGGTPQSAQDPKASLYSWWPGVNSVPNPTMSELNLGKIIFYLINYLRKKKWKKRNSFFKCWQPF